MRLEERRSASGQRGEPSCAKASAGRHGARKKDSEATLQALRQEPLGQLRLNKKADIQEPKAVDIDVGKQEGVSSSFEVSEPDSEDGIDEHKEIALSFDIVQLQ